MSLHPSRSPSPPRAAGAAALLERARLLTGREVDASDVEEILLASGNDRALLNQARARCLASLQERRGDHKGARALDVLDRAIEDLEECAGA